MFTRTEEDIVVYSSKIKSLGYCLLCLVLTLLFLGWVWFLVTHLTWFNLVFAIFFLIVAVLLAAGMVGFILQFLRKEVIIITREGVYDQTSPWAKNHCFIPWDQIMSASVTSVRRQRFVSLKMKDPEGYISSLPKYRQRTARLNSRLGFGEASLSMQSVKKMKAEELATIIKKRIPDFPQESLYSHLR